MGGDMLWFIALEENLCKVFIRTEGKWLLALCFSETHIYLGCVIDKEKTSKEIWTQIL